MLPLQMLYFEDLSVGMTETLKKTIDSSDVVGFAEVTGDRNPIHLSEHFAAKTPFGARIAHGSHGKPDLGRARHAAARSRCGLHFTNPEFPRAGEDRHTVDVSVEVAELIAEKSRARLSCRCSVDGEVVLDGEAWVKVPSKQATGRPLPRIESIAVVARFGAMGD